jgi:hypothetical protein
MGYSKPYYSYKFKQSGHRYKVGLCIKTGDICWWHGPYEPGDWNDQMIFEDALAKNWSLQSNVRQIGVIMGVPQQKLNAHAVCWQI